MLIAPAADFTEALMRPRLPPAALAALERDGVWTRLASRAPDRSAALCWRTARAGRCFPAPCRSRRPTRILQGGEDDAVPWRHALEFAQALRGRDVVFTLIRDGDHRLNRPADLARMVATIDEMIRY